MNKTIQILSEVVKENPLKEKLLFVLSYSIGHQIGECPSRSGTSWINLRVIYRDLWEKMTGEQVKEAGLFFVDGGKWVSVRA